MSRVIKTFFLYRQLVENGSVLSQAIESSRGNVKEMMEEFKLSTMEQRNMIFEVFDRVSRLQVSTWKWFLMTSNDDISFFSRAWL